MSRSTEVLSLCTAPPYSQANAASLELNILLYSCIIRIYVWDSEIFATYPEVNSWTTSEIVGKKPYTRWNVHRTHHTEQALTHILCLTVEKVAPSQFEIAILPTFHKIVIFIQMAFFLEERKDLRAACGYASACWCSNGSRLNGFFLLHSWFSLL